MQQQVPEPAPWRRGGFPAVVAQLLAKLQHCCFGDTWPVRLGGLAGLEAVCAR